MGIKFANNAAAELVQPLSTVDTTLLLKPGTGVLFPTLLAGDFFYAVVSQPSGVFEVVKVTARVSDTLTVVRGQDGTLPTSFPASTPSALVLVSLTATAQVFRTLSWQELAGAAFGPAVLDQFAKLPASNLPAEALTEAEGDIRYVLQTSKGQLGGVASLDAAGKLPVAQIPASVLLAADAANTYVAAADKAVANGVATLDDTGKLEPTQFPIAPANVALLDGSLPFTGLVTVQDKVNATGFNASGASVLSSVVADSLTANTVIATQSVRVGGGSVRGVLTLSTAPPSGTPADGDEWVQYV